MSSPVETSAALRPVEAIRADLEHPHTAALTALHSTTIGDGPIGRLLRDVEPLLARIAAVEAAIPAILMPIEMLRHGVHCTMRQAIYDGARCSCRLTSQIRDRVEAQIRAVLAASPTPTGPERQTCEHGHTGWHRTKLGAGFDSCPGPATPEETP